MPPVVEDEPPTGVPRWPADVEPVEVPVVEECIGSVELVLPVGYSIGVEDVWLTGVAGRVPGCP